MAKSNSPENFPFDKPTEWLDWKQRFERYRLATKLDKDDGEVQVSCLIYAMGNEAENIYKSFTFTEDGHRNDLFDEFDEYFFPRRNIIHERACFHQRVQRPGERAECFIPACTIYRSTVSLVQPESILSSGYWTRSSPASCS